jgi:hypothetical protein
MSKFLAILIPCLFICSMSQCREVFRKYISQSEIYFKDGHFRIQRNGKLIKLKVLRVNNGGIYYTPRDVCSNKHAHTHHDK